MPYLKTNTEWFGYMMTRADRCNKVERELSLWRVATGLAMLGQLVTLAALAATTLG